MYDSGSVPVQSIFSPRGTTLVGFLLREVYVLTRFDAMDLGPGGSVLGPAPTRAASLFLRRHAGSAVHICHVLIGKESGRTIPFASRALPTETNVESGTSPSKSGTSVNSNNSGNR